MFTQSNTTNNPPINPSKMSPKYPMLFAEGLLSSAQDSFRLVADRLDTFTDKAFSRSLRISSTLAFVSLQTQEEMVSIFEVVCRGDSGVVVV